MQNFTAKELTELKSAMVGVMLQACIPMLFSMPQVINLAMYNISKFFQLFCFTIFESHYSTISDSAIRLEKSFWVVINFLNYFTLFLNPMVTMLFVKQFRIATIRFIKNGSMLKSTTSVQDITPSAAPTPMFRRSLPSVLITA